MREWLEDPEAPWWAKLRRAQVHINEVRQRVDALQSAGIWSIEREPAADGCSYRFRLHRADGWAYRFRINRAVPADLLAAVGDAVANMRSALDYVAYELARHHVVEMGGEMGDEEEAATAFPIHVDQASFDRFFVVGRWGPVRNRLYGDVERKALQCVQPFALADEARAVGVEPSTHPQDDLLTDHAYALNAVWNIDKHRRLPEVAWTLGNLVWWSRDGAAYQWIGHIGEFAPLEDGTVLGELHNRSGSGRPEVDPHLEIEIVLADDPSPYKSPLVARLESLHRSLAGWVIPRVFIVAEGNPPPMMISFSPPSYNRVSLEGEKVGRVCRPRTAAAGGHHLVRAWCGLSPVGRVHGRPECSGCPAPAGGSHCAGVVVGGGGAVDGGGVLAITKVMVVSGSTSAPALGDCEITVPAGYWSVDRYLIVALRS